MLGASNPYVSPSLWKRHTLCPRLGAESLRSGHEVQFPDLLLHVGFGPAAGTVSGLDDLSSEGMGSKQPGIPNETQAGLRTTI